MSTTNEALTRDHVHPSGEQWIIRHAEWEACIVEVGGSLRTLTRDGEAVAFGYPASAKADAARGHVLTPWPNRIRDGKYTFEGKEYELPLTEPSRHNASHGLTRWQPWSLVSRSTSALTVGLTLHPQPGWDWTLRIEVTYSLDTHGLTVTPKAQNLSTTSCPFAWGMHPYLTLGEGTVDELTVTAPVGTRIVTDEQLIPVGTGDADPALRSGLPLIGTQLDTCFTGLVTDADGRWRVHLTRTPLEAHGTSKGLSPDEPAISRTLWADAAFSYLQLFTGDSLPEATRRRTGIAVEPMTCPANAFNSGDGLLRLEPGEEWSASFGIG